MKSLFAYKPKNMLQGDRSCNLELNHRRIYKLFSNLKQEDGVALIMVLTIIFILSTLGGIALLTTMSNIRMAEKYTTWTSEYYSLDEKAEKRLENLDAALCLAESYASAYLQDEYFQSANVILDITGNEQTELSKQKQDYIYDRWVNEVYTPSLLIDELGIEQQNETVYNNLFKRFQDDLFRRLYYYYACQLVLQEIEAGMVNSMEISPAMTGYIGMFDNYSEDRDGLKVILDVVDGKEAYNKHISVTLSIQAPRIETETKMEEVPFKGNPIWTNAMTAKGNLVFEGSENRVQIIGDIYAQDASEFYPLLNDYIILEGNQNGIRSAGAAITISGNVYSRGDFHITADGGKLDVRRYPDEMMTVYKRNVYGNSLFFDTSTMPAMIQRYTQFENARWERDFIPFFYRDYRGGNVYCNNLSIEEDVSNAAIRIENGGYGESTLLSGGTAGALPGVVWTMDDVQNDGIHSSILIQGNLVGISSEALFEDHTTSSAVINTNYQSSKIELAGDAVVPGTAFRRFDGVNDQVDENTYFETAESISATNNDILRVYSEQPKYKAEAPYFFDRYFLHTEKGRADIFLINCLMLHDKVGHLIRNLSGKIPETGIIMKENFAGYTRGAVIAEDEDGNRRVYGMPGFAETENYREILHYTQNQLAYSEIRDSLKTAFLSKTEKFGTANASFRDLVNKEVLYDIHGDLKDLSKSRFFFFVGDSEMEISEKMDGIIYCAADADGELPTLTLSGNGHFRGTIISEGDIKVVGSPTIEYHEKTIADQLLNHQIVKDFFQPGETGETSYIRLYRVAYGTTKTSKERYRIIDWSEWQE